MKKKVTVPQVTPVSSGTRFKTRFVLMPKATKLKPANPILPFPTLLSVEMPVLIPSPSAGFP